MNPRQLTLIIWLGAAVAPCTHARDILAPIGVSKSGGGRQHLMEWERAELAKELALRELTPAERERMRNHYRLDAYGSLIGIDIQGADATRFVHEHGLVAFHDDVESRLTKHFGLTTLAAGISYGLAGEPLPEPRSAAVEIEALGRAARVATLPVLADIVQSQRDQRSRRTWRLEIENESAKVLTAKPAIDAANPQSARDLNAFVMLAFDDARAKGVELGAHKYGELEKSRAPLFKPAGALNATVREAVLSRETPEFITNGMGLCKAGREFVAGPFKTLKQVTALYRAEAGKDGSRLFDYAALSRHHFWWEEARRRNSVVKEAALKEQIAELRKELEAAEKANDSYLRVTSDDHGANFLAVTIAAKVRQRALHLERIKNITAGREALATRFDPIEKKGLNEILRTIPRIDPEGSHVALDLFDPVRQKHVTQDLERTRPAWLEPHFADLATPRLESDHIALHANWNIAQNRDAYAEIANSIEPFCAFYERAQRGWELARAQQPKLRAKLLAEPTTAPSVASATNAPSVASPSAPSIAHKK